MHKPSNLLEVYVAESGNRFFKLYNLYFELLKILIKLPIYADKEDYLRGSDMQQVYSDKEVQYRDSL